MTEVITTETEKTTEQRLVEGTIENAHGKPVEEYGVLNEDGTLVKSVDFSGPYEHILKFSAIPAQERLTEEDQLKVVNEARKANARQKYMGAALDAAGIKKPELKTDRTLQVKMLLKVYMASGKTEDEAMAIINASL